MDAWGTPGAEENTTAPEGNNPDTRADDHIEQLQTWFIQEAEKELQEVTLEGDHDHNQSPLLWQRYQREIAAARTTRPWKSRLPTLGQMQEESGTSADSYWTNGECTQHAQWLQQSTGMIQIHNQEEHVRWQHSTHTNAAQDGRGTGCTDIARQQHQHDIVMLDSVHNDTGRWRLLGIRERV